MSNYTPAGVITTFWKWFWVGVLALVLLGGLTLGMWQAGWWFSNHDIGRQTQQIQNSDSNQRSLVSDITNQIASVDDITTQMAGTAGQQLADLHAQRLGVARIACNDAAQLSSADVLGGGVPQWIRANCTAGTVSPSSPLEGN
jgi:hypothetical protein